MSTSYITLKGTIKWAKVYEPDEAFGQKNFKINFYPADGKEWEKFYKTGLQLKIQEDIDGKFITFRRPVTKVIKDDLVVFSPPEIRGQVNVSYQDEEGNIIRQFNKGEKVKVERKGNPVDIGNGSEATINLSYYSTAKGPGHRLESITITNLVEYIPSGLPKFEDTSVVKTEVKKEETPEKIDEVKKDNDLNDDIPW